MNKDHIACNARWLQRVENVERKDIVEIRGRFKLWIVPADDGVVLSRVFCI